MLIKNKFYSNLIKTSNYKVKVNDEYLIKIVAKGNTSDNKI